VGALTLTIRDRDTEGALRHASTILYPQGGTSAIIREQVYGSTPLRKNLLEEREDFLKVKRGLGTSENGRC
jgi:hypothetical protein